MRRRKNDRPPGFPARRPGSFLDAGLVGLEQYMFTKAEKIFSLILIVVSAAVGILGYAAPGPSTPPKRVWLDAAGGDVIFDHSYHAAFSACADCHHNYEEGAAGAEMNCRACHYYGEAKDSRSDDAAHPRFIGQNCTACHVKYRMDVVCSTCHARQGRAYVFSGNALPALPDSVSFDTAAGRVLFDHKRHITADVGEPCATCHHTCTGGTEMKGMACRKNCRECHYGFADKIPKKDEENHKRYIGVNCTDCHGADDCAACHKK